MSSDLELFEYLIQLSLPTLSSMDESNRVSLENRRHRLSASPKHGEDSQTLVKPEEVPPNAAGIEGVVEDRYFSFV